MFKPGNTISYFRLFFDLQGVPGTFNCEYTFKDFFSDKDGIKTWQWDLYKLFIYLSIHAIFRWQKKRRVHFTMDAETKKHVLGSRVAA